MAFAVGVLPNAVEEPSAPGIALCSFALEARVSKSQSHVATEKDILMKAIFFGSIGTVVETSEVQRQAFNDAFSQLGLDWYWDEQSYRDMLSMSGGAKRVERYAFDRGQTVDAAKVHALKTELFQKAMKESPPALRDGVAETIRFAKEQDLYLGFVSTTDENTVQAIADLVQKRTGYAFDVNFSRALGRAGKPDPAVYLEALEALRLSPNDVLAIEDNKDGVASAQSAEIFTIGFPGALTRQTDLDATDLLVTDKLFEAVRNQILPPVKKAV